MTNRTTMQPYPRTPEELEIQRLAERTWAEEEAQIDARKRPAKDPQPEAVVSTRRPARRH
jgi:hypothetical protein